MAPRPTSRLHFGRLVFAAGLASAIAAGCGSKTPESDTAEYVSGPASKKATDAAKPAPEPAKEAPAPEPAKDAPKQIGP